MKKRILALVICLVMLLGALPVRGYEVTSEGLLPFTDARKGWYLPAVTFCYANGMMKGTAPDRFDPKGETTREQMMTVIANISGEEVSGYSQCPFDDVKENAWYTDYVNWAVAKGITSGKSETLFGIRKPLTRQETVTLLFNYYASTNNELVADNDLSDFSDREEVADWAREAFIWAVSYGIVAGDNGRLKPYDNITRAELSQIIRSYSEIITYGDCEHEYTTATCTKASYCTLCGMVEGLPLGHRHEPVTCTKASSCIDCGLVIAASGHSYIGADCTKPMTCSVCKSSSGTPLGHTTDNGVCARCQKEIFSSSFAKFVYYMNARGMTDGNVKYLKAEVTHPDGNTSTQFVRYDTLTGKGSLEILFDYASNDHSVKTVIYFNSVSTSYTVETYYSIGKDIRYYGSGKMTAADCGYTLNSYNGNSSYKGQFEAVAKNSALLCLDASSKLMKAYLNMTAADLGFAAFK